MTVNNTHSPGDERTCEGTAGPGRFSRRRLFVGVIGAPVLVALVAACGDPNADPAPRDTTSDPGPTDPGMAAIAHPTAPDTAIIRLAYEGGFVPVETLFVNLPTLIVSGDGRVFVPGAVPEIYPGPLLAPMGVRTISEAGIQGLLGVAFASGLLAPPPDYSAEMTVADAPDTVVRFVVDDGTFEHRASALGLSFSADGATADESTPDRQVLLDYVLKLGDLATTVGSTELGEETLFEPSAFRVRATPVTEAELAALEPAPTIVDWPDTAGLDLATATDCARVGAESVGTLFADANQLTHFRQGEVVYRLAVASVLPGDASC